MKFCQICWSAPRCRSYMLYDYKKQNKFYLRVCTKIYGKLMHWVLCVHCMSSYSVGNGRYLKHAKYYWSKKFRIKTFLEIDEEIEEEPLEKCYWFTSTHTVIFVTHTGKMTAITNTFIHNNIKRESNLKYNMLSYTSCIPIIYVALDFGNYCHNTGVTSHNLMGFPHSFKIKHIKGSNLCY